MSPFVQPENIQKATPTFDFNLYPNPVRDLLVVQLVGDNLEVKNEVTHYSIYNSQGVKVRANNLNDLRDDQRFFIETNTLGNGYYYLVIEQDGTQIGKSFVKMR